MQKETNNDKNKPAPKESARKPIDTPFVPFDNVEEAWFWFVLALYNMMRGEEPKIGDFKNTNASDNMDLQSMMRDKDPSFVAKVTEGFQKMYGK